MHYSRLKRNGDPFYIAEKLTCSIENCPYEHHAKGYCNTHYRRYQKHGDPNFKFIDHRSNHPLNATYLNMLRRCYDPVDKDYKNYGARGITVYDKWLRKRDGILCQEGFWRYAEYIENLEKPSELHNSLDRINNNGNYEPGNLRWATKTTQNTNKRPFKNSTGYPGVGKFGSRWYSRVVINGTRIKLGVFDTPEEAYKEYMKAKEFYYQSDIDKL